MWIYTLNLTYLNGTSLEDLGLREKERERTRYKAREDDEQRGGRAADA
jgi:hypothetical protein